MLLQFKEVFKYKFPRIKRMEKSFSQSYQDLFVLTMLDEKSNGNYLEIGAMLPLANNNTYVLESRFGYKGISIEITNQHEQEWKQKRPDSNLLIADATTIDYKSLLKYHPKRIDYLQIDIDNVDEQFNILKNLLLSDHYFSVITYETDIYTNMYENNSSSAKIKKQVKELLEEAGYLLLVENVGVINGLIDQKTYGQLVPFEDWYIYPSAINENIYNLFKNVGSEVLSFMEIFLDYEILRNNGLIR